MTVDDSCQPERTRHFKRCRKRRRVVAGAVVVMLGTAAAYVLLSAESGDAESSTDSAKRLSTVAIKRADLVQTAAFDGTLTFANPRTISVVEQGVVTALPASGATITQGKQIYAVDAAGPYLFYGGMPMYRTLSSGVSDGPDIKQLETGLKAAGFDPDGMTVDEHWGASTTAAVNAWKDSIGRREDGRVTPQELHFAAGPLRVDSVSAVVGQRVAANAGVFVATDTSRLVTVALETADAPIARVDDPVSVQLPDGGSATGRIRSVATSAASAEPQSGTASEGGTTNTTGASGATAAATVDVTITLDDGADVGSLSTAPVTVVFTQRRAEDVLAVPVSALLAVTDGGFALEIDDGARGSHLESVTPGLYSADGLVEVEGPGLSEGTRVVVPTSS